jgi:signal transduction histidine kinase
LHVTALRLAPVTVVQPLGVTAVVVSVLWGARVRRRRPVRATVLALAAIVAGTAGFAVLAARVTVATPVTATAQLWGCWCWPSSGSAPDLPACCPAGAGVWRSRPVPAVPTAACRSSAGPRARSSRRTGHYDDVLDVPGEPGLAALVRDVNSLAATLADTERSRGRLVSEIAHEMRTPISILRGQIVASLGVRTVVVAGCSG